MDPPKQNSGHISKKTCLLKALHNRHQRKQKRQGAVIHISGIFTIRMDQKHGKCREKHGNAKYGLFFQICNQYFQISFPHFLIVLSSGTYSYRKQRFKITNIYYTKIWRNKQEALQIRKSPEKSPSGIIPVRAFDIVCLVKYEMIRNQLRCRSSST